MMIRSLRAAVVAVGLLALVGCGDGGQRIKTVEAPSVDPIAEAKAILNNYANGMPVTSEASEFPDLVARVKAKDPAKGDILEKGLADIQKSKSGVREKAKALLQKL